MDDVSFAVEPEGPIRVAILGSTGSIGRQALDVCRANPGRFQVTALAAGTDWEGLMSQAKEFEVGLVGIGPGSYDPPQEIKVIGGDNSAAEIAESCDAHVVLNAVMGAAGLKATLATIASEKNLALANKESLVTAGELVMGKVAPGQLRPVDSEHSALWQVLEGLRPDQVRKVILTGSGGPFRGRTAEELQTVNPAEALAHPVWEMGPKITIDSATLMNKGLEVIEAHFLFGFTYDEIEVVIHPEGIVHAMAETVDGAVFAHAAPPDMRLPIQLALAWPERLGPPGAKRIDWTSAQKMTFEPPDLGVFKCFNLAVEAGRRGDTYPAVLNASNEVAVKAFLEQRLPFTDISTVVEQTLEAHAPSEPQLDGVLEADRWARNRANEIIARTPH
ncbi:MAG: 1-deoxy-D-xylulose-5-phosphate reductoisomerase [Actinomycetota bacterium]